ncbi:ABC transporter ATP-binding protein [Bacillus subtilis]|nr:ABC transporter ATP-binding protein [Bacillus subtilis]MED3694471.1 ABC transporter ATP-binding protein [Bacillus subtilis]
MSYVMELQNIRKAYGKHIVLENVNIVIEKGEMVAITGSSGSGKTTILNIMGMLEKPDGGIVKILGDVAPRIGSGRANELLRSKISYLFQNYALIDNASISANLDVPLTYKKLKREEKEKLKIAVLEKVGLQKVSLTQKVHELSGGEQQRLAIARIILKPCDIILADEPTGSLDVKNRNEIITLLKELNQMNKTIIIVTHDPYVSNQCSRVIELN